MHNFNFFLKNNIFLFGLKQKNIYNIGEKNIKYLKSNNLFFKIKLKKKQINFFPRKIKERIFGDLFLRFFESFFGSKVFFFFVRNLWVHYNNFIFVQEYLFAKRICQYGSYAMKKKNGQ
jgi:hypothetical protein